MRGYEVLTAMEEPMLEEVMNFTKLRIPMRGYEHYINESITALRRVTNPHAGL